MTHAMNVECASWEPLSWWTLAFVCAALLYVRGWYALRSSSVSVIQRWRGASFLVGLSLVWVALASPIASCDTELLTVHMVRHLLLMTVAAPLIWLGEPLRASLCGLPQHVVSSFVRPVFGSLPMQRCGAALARPSVSWCAATATLVGWHIPKLFALGMQSETWHAVEYASFLASGLLFWWPVVRPWPSRSPGGGWSTIVYLFLATLPCDVLSAFLVFSERVAYPVYLSMPRHAGLGVLEDQQCAGALMWTAVTIVYLVAAGILSAQLLSPPGITAVRVVLHPGRDADGVEVV
jgi:cytochrome c oxidase assembly factor CtaG